MMSGIPAVVEAVTIAKTGGLDVIEQTTQPFPLIRPTDVVLKLEYLGVNFIDIYWRSGLHPIPGHTFPARIGEEGAGTVVALPSDPSTLDDPDFKRMGLAIGGKASVVRLSHAVTGLEPERIGCHATYVSLHWSHVCPVPSSFTRVAAAATIQGLTAVTFLDEAYEIQKGDTILIYTVAGGLGLLLAQIAHVRGATVIGTTSNEEKAQLAKSHGADHVILYTKENVVERVLELTNGEGVHAVFDGIGKDTFDMTFQLIRRKGTFVTHGSASGVAPNFSPAKLTPKNVKLVYPSMYNYIVTPAEVLRYSRELFELIETGQLDIRIFKEYPFTADGVRQAHQDLAEGKTAGKLIIKVADD